jgi:hypothetical protein
MEIVEDWLDLDLDEFLDRPLFCFLAQCSDDGARISPLWYLWEDEIVWLIAQLPNRSYPERVEQFPQSAIAIVEFDPQKGLVRHVGMRGEATLEPFDHDRAERLLGRYLGDDKSDWNDGFISLDGENYRLIRLEPETVVARGGTHDTGLER